MHVLTDECYDGLLRGIPGPIPPQNDMEYNINVCSRLPPTSNNSYCISTRIVHQLEHLFKFGAFIVETLKAIVPRFVRADVL